MNACPPSPPCPHCNGRSVGLASDGVRQRFQCAELKCMEVFFGESQVVYVDQDGSTETKEQMMAGKKTCGKCGKRDVDGRHTSKCKGGTPAKSASRPRSVAAAKLEAHDLGLEDLDVAKVLRDVAAKLRARAAEIAAAHEAKAAKLEELAERFEE